MTFHGNLNLGSRFLGLGFRKLLANRLYFKGSEGRKQKTKISLPSVFQLLVQDVFPKFGRYLQNNILAQSHFLMEDKSLSSHWPKGSILRPLPSPVTGLGLGTQGDLSREAWAPAVHPHLAWVSSVAQSRSAVRLSFLTDLRTWLLCASFSPSQCSPCLRIATLQERLITTQNL